MIMTDAGFALFETPIGACGIAWRAGALAGLQLPERDERAAMKRLARRFPELAPATMPAWVEQVADGIRTLLRGEAVDLGLVPLDFGSVAAFEAAVYRATRDIPPGRTVTYGALAERLGDTGLARAVGQALGRNPWPIVVPCHRVTAAAGGTGGFSAPGGRATKLKLLEIEGALAPESLPLFGAAG
jgi:methylated-DNA-[protein]-cysteine S-methyltransferase